MKPACREEVNSIGSIASARRRLKAFLSPRTIANMNRRQFLKTTLGLSASALLSTRLVSAQTLVQRRIRCPILMYHYISPLPADADRIRRDLTVVPEMFDQHCQQLVLSGYTTVSMAQLAQALLQGAALPERPVVLTFDDGYAGMYDYALPTLQKYQMVGTFFVITRYLDNPGYLSWGQAGVLLQSGMEVENHSMTHPSLSRRDDAYLMNEIEGAAEAIEVTFNRRPHFFCYPAGEFDENTIRIVQATGHSLAVTTDDGMILDSSDPYRLPRVRIRGTTDVGRLDWLLAR